MIDEKKLIYYIMSEINPYGRPFDGTVFEFGCKVMEYIENMEKINEWIPCSERLPKETDFPEQKYRILASCSDGIVRNATIEDLRDRSKKHFNGSRCEFAYLAWQPLPEPYKE